MAVLSDQLVVTTGDDRIALTDLDTSGIVWSQEFESEETDACPWVAASLALQAIYCAGFWGTIEERSLRTGAPTGVVLNPQLGFVGPIAVTSEGRELVVVGRSSPTIARWMLDGSGLASRLLVSGWSVVGMYSRSDPQVVIARREEGSASEHAYTEFAVLDTASGEVRAHSPYRRTALRGPAMTRCSVRSAGRARITSASSTPAPAPWCPATRCPRLLHVPGCRRRSHVRSTRER